MIGRKEQGIIPVYKMVDTCAAEFESKPLISTERMKMKMNQSDLTERKVSLS